MAIQRVKIGDIARVKGGKRLPPGAELTEQTTGHPYLRIVDFREDGVDETNVKSITPEVHALISRYTISSKDVYVSIAGTIGRVGMVPAHLNGANLTENAAKICEIENRALPQYLMFFLRSWEGQAQLAARAGGAAQAKLALNRIETVELPLPLVEHQKSIVTILSAYGDLIENNTRRIAILEEMARLIYEEWFVRFKAPGLEGVPMIDSELGPIPEGWSVGCIENIVELQRGFDLPSKSRTPGPYPVIASTGVSESHSEFKVRAPGVVTGRSGSLGKVLHISEDFWPLNTTLWGKRFPSGSTYLAFFVLQKLPFAELNAGAAVPTLNRNHVHTIPSIVPPRPVIEAFDSIIEPIFALKRTLERQNANLRAQRDLLLPRLISGEIDVSNLEPLAEAAE